VLPYTESIARRTRRTRSFGKTLETLRWLDQSSSHFRALPPNCDYFNNDDRQTPPALASRLVDHFKPLGRELEPCRGGRNIFRRLPRGRMWCEIKVDRDVFAWGQPVGWIVTNSARSQVRRFIYHAMGLSENVVFLLTINHVWTKGRLRDIRAARFGLREILPTDIPPQFP
jgi:hypothetical protein